MFIYLKVHMYIKAEFFIIYLTILVDLPLILNTKLFSMILDL
jgi:hypothetical protein